MPNVRTATPEDLVAVVALWDRAAGPTRRAGRHEDAARLLARDPEALIVAVDDGGTLVGTIIVGWDGWRAHLYRLAVAPEARRGGVARALVHAAARHATSLGAVRLDAMVHAGNTDAIAFWRAAGYAVEGDDERWSLAPSATHAADTPTAADR